MDFSICDHTVGFPKYSHIYQDRIIVLIKIYVGGSLKFPWANPAMYNFYSIIDFR